MTLRVVWGITGSGDLLRETVTAMAAIREAEEVEITTVLSRAAVKVLRWYKLEDEVRRISRRVFVEEDANTPFIVGPMQIGRYDCFLVAPATANTLAKMAAGVADNLLTATYLAFRGPVIVAPTMNWAMYEHPATQDNLRTLAARGVEVLPGERGDLACGEEGSGRMASPEAILMAVRRAFAREARGPLAGRRVVVTAGGTREAVDAVRFIGNRSSGKMGRAVADEAYLRGADVVLVTTVPTEAAPYEVVAVESAADMAATVSAATASADVLVMAAAVADFRPRSTLAGKIGRDERESLTLELERTVDILAAATRPGLLRVGFAAEAGPRLDRARAKRAAKGVDLLVFNDILAAGVGIGADDNEITIIGADGETHVPRTSKRTCAAAIVDAIERALRGSA